MFTHAEYGARRARLLERMEAGRLDSLVLYSSKPESGYVRYYAGYESQLAIMDCCYLAVTPGHGAEWTLVTNAFWDEPFGQQIREIIVSSDFERIVPGLLPGRLRRLGLAPLGHFPAGVYRKLARPGLEITDVKEQLLELRAVKSAAEIEMLRRVAVIADSGARAFAEAAAAGATELEVAARVEFALRRAGSGPLIFSTLLSSGPRTGKFIALPTDRRLAPGELVQLDCGPSLEGYHGDLSRCLAPGDPPPGARRLLEATALMYEACLAALRPGRRASEVACEVLRAARELGYGPENLYQSPNVKPGFVGHGIGLGNPDAPQISTEDHTLLAAGMVINIETILRDPALGSARIEDAVVIEPAGAVRLSETPIRLGERAA